MFAQYAERVEVHPDRYGKTRPLPPVWVVLHTSEGGEGDGAAEALARYMQQPGDRPSPSRPGGVYGSSYHAIADTHLTVIPATLDSRVAFAASGANTEGLHICIPGRAGQTRPEWMSPTSRAAIRTVAAFILDTRSRYGIPAERLTASEMSHRTRGYCDHATVRDAFGRTNHSDVGPNFPWDVLAADIRDLSRPLPPSGDDHMLPLQLRMSDTRLYGNAGKLPAKQARRFAVPSSVRNVRAIQVSIVAVDPSAPGYVSAWGSGTKPETSVLNYNAGQTINTSSVVEVDDGSIQLWSAVSIHVVIDIQAVWT